MSDNQLNFRVGWDGQPVNDGIRQTTNVFERFKQQLVSSREAITSFNAWLDVTKQGFAAMQKGVEFLREGAIFAEAQANFRATAASYGQFSDTIIEASKKASDNQVSTLNLIKSNTRAMQLGVASDAGTLAKLWEIANAKSDQFGESMVTTFDKIVTAVGKGQGRLLIELGLLPESFARSANAADLLKNRAEILKTVLSQGADEIARLSGVTNTANDAIGRYDAAMDDLKGSFGEIATAMTPAINAFATLVGLMAKFIDVSGRALKVAFTSATWKQEFGENQFIQLAKKWQTEGKDLETITKDLRSKREELIDEQNRIKAEIQAYRVAVKTPPKVPSVKGTWPDEIIKSAFAPIASDKGFALPAKATSNRKNIVEINQAIGLMIAMEKQKKEADEVRIKIEGLNDALDGTGKKSKKAAAHAYDLGKALQTAFSSGSEYASKDTFGQWADDLGVALKHFQKFEEAIGTTKLRGVTSMMEDLANSVGQFTVEIKKAYEYARQEYHKSTLELTPEKAWDLLNKHSTSITGGVSLPAKGVTLDTEEIENRILQEQNAAVERFKEKLTINVADAFETGLYDGLNGGNFLDSFGKALRSQVARAFAASVTANLFQGGSSFQMGAAGGSGFSILNPATYIPAIASALSPQQSKQSQGSSVGGLGGLLDFGPMMKGGQVQWGNLTQYAAAGAALQFLTSPGRLFGGTVVHGQEAVQQASDINSRVSQARTDRQALIGTVGLSEDTVKKLSDLVFWTAGYNKNESGDGWFKGPKTTTYELNATQANAALEEFTKLTKQAQIDLAKRAYEIGTTQLDRPFTALQMSLDDLREALTRTVDEESRYALQLQIKQAESQKQSFWAGNLNDWTSFGISTPMAGFGPKKKLSYGYEPAGEGTYPEPDSNRPWSIFDAVRDEASAASKAIWELYANPTGPYHIEEGEKALGYKLFNPADMAAEKLKGGFSVPEGKYVVNGTKLGVEEFESWAGTQIMTRGLRNQGSAAWDIQEQIARGAKPWDVEVDGQKYTDILTDRLGSYQTMLDELDEKISDETLTMAQRSQLFSQFTAALTAYYGAKQEALDLELQQEADLKNKRDQRTDDILGTLLSRVGEISTNKAGQQVIVLSPGQPDGRALAREIIDAIGGEKPELATALTQFLNQTAKPYF